MTYVPMMDQILPALAHGFPTSIYGGANIQLVTGDTSQPGMLQGPLRSNRLGGRGTRPGLFTPRVRRWRLNGWETQRMGTQSALMDREQARWMLGGPSGSRRSYGDLVPKHLGYDPQEIRMPLALSPARGVLATSSALLGGACGLGAPVGPADAMPTNLWWASPYPIPGSPVGGTSPSPAPVAALPGTPASATATSWRSTGTVLPPGVASPAWGPSTPLPASGGFPTVQPPQQDSVPYSGPTTTMESAPSYPDYYSPFGAAGSDAVIASTTESKPIGRGMWFLLLLAALPFAATMVFGKGRKR